MAGDDVKTLTLGVGLVGLTAMMAATERGDDPDDEPHPPGYRTRPEPPARRDRPPPVVVTSPPELAGAELTDVSFRFNGGCRSAGCRTLARCLCECRKCRIACRAR